MRNKVKSSCTTILVGKKASIDGSTMIARNEDSEKAIEPKRFIVVQPESQPKIYESKISHVSIPLPENPLRYTATPNADDSIGIWGEAGINQANVAMTATETITSNSRILGVDPYVENGIGEEDLLTIVLPYISSAREGVTRLGQLLEEYGTYEPNALAFSDNDEIWYFETIGGHHWAAIKIPDEAYVIAPNRMNIDTFEVDSENTMCSEDLVELIENNHLNPNPEEALNLRHIFGSATIKDHHYNNPRAWYGQKYFTPEIVQDPMDDDLPFICYANRKISVEEIKFVLSSHYQDTVFDAYGVGTDQQKKSFRPIGINRNIQCHILQLRNDVPKSISGIQWLAFGPNTFNVLVPFYTNVEQTPARYSDTSTSFDFNHPYWLFCMAALIGDYDYDRFTDIYADYEQESMASFRNKQLLADAQATKDFSTDYLEKINQQLAEECYNRTVALLGQMVEKGATQMTLRFDLGD